MKLHTPTRKPAAPGIVQPPRDRQHAVPVPQIDVVAFPGLPLPAVSCAVLFAQFSAVLMANLVLMSSIAANSLVANQQRRVDH